MDPRRQLRQGQASQQKPVLVDVIPLWGQLPVNMLAAFMHVGADFIRSITTTVEGFFLIANFPPGINGDVVDAWSCMVITVIVVAAILYGLFEVFRDIVIYCKTGE